MLAVLGRRKDAVEAYNRSTALDPNFAEAWYNKGVSLAALGQRDDAIVAYNRAIALKPDYFKAWYNLGLSQKFLGKNQDAIRCFRKCIEFASPDYASQVKDIEQMINKL